MPHNLIAGVCLSTLNEFTSFLIHVRIQKQ